MKAWVGLGSNLQEPVKQLYQALNRLDSVAGTEVLRTSSFYRTPPWGDERQDDFINAVAEIDTISDPIALLHELQTIENLMGRSREGPRWGPRLIDLDLLLYGDQVIQSDELVLPHPRMHERAFVLLPLHELEANLEIPEWGPVDELLRQFDCSGIIRLDIEGREFKPKIQGSVVSNNKLP